MTSAPETMRNHWWWRPGWKIGRRFYTWHFTFEDQPKVRQLVTDYQARLAQLQGLDPIPLEWLHLTTQGIGFADEVPDTDVDAVVSAARRRLAEIPPVNLTVGPAVIDPEVIRLQISPVDALTGVRRALRAAIADALGPERLPESDEWNPHVSVAYSNADGPMDSIAAALVPELKPVAVTIRDVQLIVLGRDRRIYEWQNRAAVPLTG
ncbi:MAG TPA: 2'-5' RNA ligase family protein [Actinomadura sp.]|jgi:hypothetical protein|nr:2'-5' RNA ligase family protein [Actinomadura sp.]